ncbi:MAG: MgtC/SapB family protein [Oscillospiraceae bacterium]|nr:MgtC/SapB family protein [Oscillospiraceae bacterium]
MQGELLFEILGQLGLFLRVLLAGVCGFVIGLERRGRMKSAGPRTHLLVCAASALMMLVSKYGFFDMFAYEAVKLDPSRVASNIITGITFMGAGLIFVHKREVTGVTTAAGLWATVGVGMALGAGMYVLGVASCVLIVLFQVLLHSNLRIFREPRVCAASITTDGKTTCFTELCEMLELYGIDMLEPKIKRDENGAMEIKFTARIAANVNTQALMQSISELPGVLRVQL